MPLALRVSRPRAWRTASAWSSSWATTAGSLSCTPRLPGVMSTIASSRSRPSSSMAAAAYQTSKDTTRCRSRALSWFSTMNLYGGGCEIERMMVTQEIQGFLDRFSTPRGY
jgi:hypothetical protein